MECEGKATEELQKHRGYLIMNLRMTGRQGGMEDF